MKTIATIFLLSLLSVSAVAQSRRVHVIETFSNASDIQTIKSLLPPDWIALESTENTEGVLMIQFELRDVRKGKGILLCFTVDRADPCRPKFDEKFRSKMMTAKAAMTAMLKDVK